SGGAVAWVSGLTFTVSPAVYYIDFNRYNSQQQNVTLPPADPVNDRIDAIVLKTDTTLDVVTGTAGAPPFQPFVDPTLYLAITYVYVPAASTTPLGVTTTMIYNENVPGEWTATSNTANIDVNSTENPYSGSKDINATNAILNDQVEFVAPLSVIMSNQA